MPKKKLLGTDEMEEFLVPENKRVVGVTRDHAIIGEGTFLRDNKLNITIHKGKCASIYKKDDIYYVVADKDDCVFILNGCTVIIEADGKWAIKTKKTLAYDKTEPFMLKIGSHTFYFKKNNRSLQNQFELILY